jgi:hypothetical protein
LTTEIDVGEAGEDEWEFFIVFISLFHRDFIIVDDAIGGAILVGYVRVDDVGRFLACLGGLVVEHPVACEIEAGMFCLLDVLECAC